ncbi:MAG: prolyl oligopeptidase family serine peptidase, partial [Myxococcota bacterium]
SKELLCTTVPSRRGQPPQASPVPTGPVIQENLGQKAPARTYQDLLKDRQDEALFDHYFTSELTEVSLTGETRALGVRGIVVYAAPSPSGQYILVETVRRPYSYLVPMSRFPWRVAVYDRRGKLVKQIADLPLAENVPIGFDSVRTGPRRVGWRADAPATLFYSMAQDGGDMKREVAVHDRLYMHAAPFRGKPTALVDLDLRAGRVYWGNENLALVTAWRWKDRRERTYIVDPSKPGQKPRVLFDRTWEDRYSDPGQPERVATPQGTWVLRTLDKGRALFFTGTGASPEGDRPFVDRLELASAKSTRLWRSSAPYYERPVRVLDQRGNRVLTRRESKTVQPNYFIRDLTSGKLDQLTRFPHPHPELRGMSKELIRYKRKDGVDLTATLYLPPRYNKRMGRLPVVMWAYPNEFKSASAASQVTDSPHRFARIGWWSPLVWLLRGYAVLDDPSMPIVGEGKVEPNDTYVEQLVSSAEAAIDELDRRGVGDRNRIAIGGHSYGAFMAANLLAHSDLFRAGIARSGAYNRTLTPFGFQAEERTLWQASPTYFKMSPFMHAEKINEPILLIHGDSDNNSGTFPMQSRRMYQALKGLGATVRLVMLPHESHGYRARQSIMHMMWETDRWLSTYVKTKRPKRAKERKTAAN